jgi:hypothetical protein
MRTLIRQARASMADCYDSESREEVATAACERIRRHTLSGYNVITLMAEQLDFPVDVARLKKLMTQSFSEIRPYPVSRNGRSSVRQLLTS